MGRGAPNNALHPTLLRCSFDFASLRSGCSFANRLTQVVGCFEHIMGLKISTIAAKIGRATFQETSFSVWNKLEPVEKHTFATFDELSRWTEAELRYTENLLAFYQDGDWAILSDTGQYRLADEKELCLLSEKVGQVIVALAHTTSSMYWFKVYENGGLRRKLCSDDGRIERYGEPLANEDILDSSRFWLTDVEHLLKSFGLRPYVADCEGEGPFAAVEVTEP